MRGFLDQSRTPVTCLQLIGNLLLLESFHHLQHKFKIINHYLCAPSKYEQETRNLKQPSYRPLLMISHNVQAIPMWNPFTFRYSDWLRAGRPRGWSSSPGRVKNVIFSTSSRPALGFTQPPIQWVPVALSWRGKAARAWSWSLTSASAEVKKMWIYTSTPHTPSWRIA
jgi:hypothetical protein